MTAGSPDPSTLAPAAEVLQQDGRFVAAFVFGSGACGELRADSDLDVAVVYADEAARRSAEADLLTVLGRLALAAGRDVHIVDLEAAGHVLRFQVFRHGRVLFDRDPRRTGRLIERTLIKRFDWEYAMRVIDRALAAEMRVHGAPGGSDAGG